MRPLTCLTVLAGALLLGAAVAQPPPPPARDSAVLERFPIARDASLVIVPVTVKGKDYPFVLDTGCTGTVYDTSLKPLLGAPQGHVQARAAAGGDANLDLFEPPEAFLGKLPLSKDAEVAAFDFSLIRERAGEDVRGLLGMDFLRDYVVAIDFDRGQVTFRRGLGETRDPGKALSLSWSGGLPHLLLDFQGVNRVNKFVIDTGALGAESGQLESELFRALLKAGQVKEVLPGGPCVSAAGKTEIALDASLGNFSVGPFNHHNLLFSAAASTANGLTLNYLSRYAVTFDFPSSTLYLKPGARFNDSIDQRARSGFELAWREGATVISAIKKDSPAEQAGLRAGDVLMSVAGVPGDRGPLHIGLHLTRYQGQTVAVRFRRDKEEREAPLRLVGWPAPLSDADVEAALGSAR
jgi:hypothetical protein